MNARAMRRLLGLTMVALVLAAGLCLLDAAGHHSASAGLCGLILALVAVAAVIPALRFAEGFVAVPSDVVSWPAVDPTTPPPR